MWEVRTGTEHTATALFVTDSGAVRPDLADRTWTALTDAASWARADSSRARSSSASEPSPPTTPTETHMARCPPLTLRLAARVEA